MDAFRYFLYMSDPVKRNLSSTVISRKPVLCVGWKTGLCQSLLWLKWFLSSAIRFRVLLSKVSRLVCMNLKKGVNITTQGKSMIFITRYFKVMNSLPVAIVSLYTQLLLLCFDTSFRFVYQYHGGLVFLFCFCRIKAKKQTDLIMFYPSGNKAFFFFFWCLGNPEKLEGGSVCFCIAVCVRKLLEVGVWQCFLPSAHSRAQRDVAVLAVCCVLVWTRNASGPAEEAVIGLSERFVPQNMRSGFGWGVEQGAYCSLVWVLA